MESCDEEGDDKKKSKLVYHVMSSLSTGWVQALNNPKVPAFFHTKR